jgi:uncharacterized protein
MAGSGAKTSVDLAHLGLSHGEGRRLEVELAPVPLSLGGQEYVATAEDPARVEISRTAHGYAFRLGFRGAVSGPCVRCLEQAKLELEIEGREIEEPRSTEEELRTPYVQDEMLDIGSWARDALVLAVPAKVLCRPDCAGLCAVCGESLNDANPAEHEHEQARDSRWAKLDELK